MKAKVSSVVSVSWWKWHSKQGRVVTMMMASSETFTNARVDKAGSTRGDDDGFHDLFKVVRTDGPVLYGEFKLLYMENGNDFNIEIGPFGYLEYCYLGSSDPTRRLRFSAEEAATLEKLIRSAFLANQGFCNSLPPARFMGGVTFRPDWIIDGSNERKL
jgi:hypothetical protein